MDDNYLVLTAVGKDHPGIVDRLSMAIVDCGCNILDSRMTVLGGEFAVLLLVAGKWNALAKLENALTGLKEELDLHIQSKRTELTKYSNKLLTYRVEVVAIDHPGIVYKIASFFSAREINIRELVTNNYAAPHTGTQMFALDMTIDIPSEIRIANLREDFLEFCDDLNMDAILEPSK